MKINITSKDIKAIEDYILTPIDVANIDHTIRDKLSMEVKCSFRRIMLSIILTEREENK